MVGVGQRVVKGGLEVFVPTAFGFPIHAFLSLCIREISGASALFLATRPSAGRYYHLPVITQQCNQLRIMHYRKCYQIPIH